MTDNANPTPDAATPPATPAAPATPPADSLLPSGQDNGGAPPATPATGDDWLPAKYQVKDAEGKLDEAASSRKLAEAYKNLETKLGAGAAAQRPATPADYKLTQPVDAEGKPVEGIDMAAFQADPMFKAVAEKAHAAGLSNEQLDVMVGQYLELAPQIAGADKVLTLEEAKAELQKVWTTEEAFGKGIGDAMRAIKAFGAPAEDVAGSQARLMAKYGTDPDFIAVMAAVAKDMREDKPINGGAGGAGGASADDLAKNPAYWDPKHPDHERVKAEVAAATARQHGTAPRRASAVGR